MQWSTPLKRICAEPHVPASRPAMIWSAHVDTFTREHLPPRELWPEFIFTRPELQYPERLNCVVQFLDRWVELGHGDEPCMLSPAEKLFLSELQELVNRIANVLVDTLGLVPAGACCCDPPIIQ